MTTPAMQCCLLRGVSMRHPPRRVVTELIYTPEYTVYTD